MTENLSDTSSEDTSELNNFFTNSNATCSRNIDDSIIENEIEQRFFNLIFQNANYNPKTNITESDDDDENISVKDMFVPAKKNMFPSSKFQVCKLTFYFKFTLNN